MGKGTAAQGKKSGKTTHLICRKCGSHSYHKKKKRCSSCGYGAGSTTRSYNWQKK